MRVQKGGGQSKGYAIRHAMRKIDDEKAKLECTAQDKKGVTGANVIAEWIALILGRERRSRALREPGG